MQLYANQKTINAFYLTSVNLRAKPEVLLLQTDLNK